MDVLDTPVSPELLPPVDGKISQKTEDLVGPYELHDFSFIIFYVLDLLPIRYTESQKLRLKMSMMTLLSLNGLRYSTAVSSASSSSVPASLTDLRSALLPSPQGVTCACLVMPAAGYGWTRLRGCEPARPGV